MTGKGGAAARDTTPVSPHAAALEALGLHEPARSRLCLYLDILASWNARVNLTAARSAEERVRLLVAAVLPAAHQPRTGRLIDVGSGNGSPGLVYALVREDLAVTLLEPRQRRWAFLRDAARLAGAAGRVEVVRSRHDEYQGRSAETVALRALALPLPELDHLVAPGGAILVLGGQPRAAAPFVEVEPVVGVPGGAWLFRRPSVPRGTLG
jgi:16S rRNA (guanine527-N7)-methyltransferase